MAQTFENNMAQLEKIIQSLEKMDITLDESLKLFEEGIKLSRKCHKTLNDAEKKVEFLIQEDGEVIGKRTLE